MAKQQKRIGPMAVGRLVVATGIGLISSIAVWAQQKSDAELTPAQLGELLDRAGVHTERYKETFKQESLTRQ